MAGLWAGIEIVAGRFLHNLKIPFSGTFLTLISIMLVTGIFQIWKQPGIIWRAGIITALMKSISPSAVILGPMIAIIVNNAFSFLPYIVDEMANPRQFIRNPMRSVELS